LVATSEQTAHLSETTLRVGDGDDESPLKRLLKTSPVLAISHSVPNYILIGIAGQKKSSENTTHSVLDKVKPFLVPFEATVQQLGGFCEGN